MDWLKSVVDVVSNVGFPIACVVAMFYMFTREQENHKAESAEWVKALNNNTIAIEKIMSLMERVE